MIARQLLCVPSLLFVLDLRRLLVARLYGVWIKREVFLCCCTREKSGECSGLGSCVFSSQNVAVAMMMHSDENTGNWLKKELRGGALRAWFTSATFGKAF
jgi:hypothetical protein